MASEVIQIDVEKSVLPSLPPDEQNKIVNDENLTLSTKLSTEQLICKTPQTSSSSSNSLNSSDKPILPHPYKICKNKALVATEDEEDDNSLLCFGILHFVFGFFMVTFGCLVIHYDANLAQLGGGIWAGCIVMSCGITGIFASAKDWCPLKSTPQRIIHTIFLVLSLVSLAISQLIMALAAIGALRDLNNSEYETIHDDQLLPVTTTTELPPGKISITLPMNYMSILTNFGLLITSLAEFIVAAITSYKSSRIICPCFQKKNKQFDEINQQNRNALVSSWLGKLNAQQPMYVVTPSHSTMSKHSQISTLTPIFAIPAHHQPPLLRYPLIPAPLGVIPSPHIPQTRKHMVRAHKHKKRFHSKPVITSHRANSTIPKKPKKVVKQVTEEDVVKTYTGLDKAIAEEFIDICDMRNTTNSLCSDSSCTNSSCQRINENSDVASREYLVHNS